MSHNEVTGARMISKPANEKFESGWDRLWGNKAKEPEPVCNLCLGEGVLWRSSLGGNDSRYSEPCCACQREPAKELTEAELEHWAEMMGHGSWEDLGD